ncbi:hypothetical protein F4774DRAFT_391712 [Daldinia eschscholtzii]|nr:hypothetical protein F4774DRAFT_391712 [Daldinia eschscholtzii]
MSYLLSLFFFLTLSCTLLCPCDPAPGSSSGLLCVTRPLFLAAPHIFLPRWLASGGPPVGKIGYLGPKSTVTASSSSDSDIPSL